MVANHQPAGSPSFNGNNTYHVVVSEDRITVHYNNTCHFHAVVNT